MFKSIELIIFDCDGVLVDSEPLANTLFARLCREHGFDLSDEEAMERFPGSRFASCVAYVEEKHGRTMPENFVDTYRHALSETFASQLQPIPGVREVLGSIRHSKVVASNGPKEKMVDNLITCRIYHHFRQDHIFSAYDIQKWKPEPDLFLTASTHLGAAPATCLVVEDSPPGVQAALAAGMQVVGFTHEGKNKKLYDLGVPLIDRMTELKRILVKG
jgi:HAD superfamily hydrolase (TIGR01509 family)